MYFDEILEKVSEPADLAIFFISFSIGFVISAVCFEPSVPHGTAAGVISLASLGLKKAVDAVLLSSEYVAKRTAQKRIIKMKRYFTSIQEERACALLAGLERMLSAQIVDYSKFNNLLDEQFRQYVKQELEEIENFSVSREELLSQECKKLIAREKVLFGDLERIYFLALEDPASSKELKSFIEDLEASHGFRAKKEHNEALNAFLSNTSSGRSIVLLDSEQINLYLLLCVLPMDFVCSAFL